MGSGFEFGLASRSLAGAIAAVAVGHAALGGLVAKRLRLASVLPPILAPTAPEPLTGGRVILVRRPVPPGGVPVKLGHVALVLALPPLAIWVVAAAMVRVRLAHCRCDRRSHG